jgi:hypothetical protein
MKRCPTCNRTYTDPALNFCLEDGTPLVNATAPDANATVRYPGSRDTEPPKTEIYHPPTPVTGPRPPAPQPLPPQQWSPAPAPPRKKSNAVWWVLGGLAALAIIGVGLVVMLIALANLGSDSNRNLNANRNANRNANVVVNTNTNTGNANVNTNSPTSITEDFSVQTWSAATSPYGRTWYDDGEYHMVSKERTWVVMYAPSDDYSTENARVSVNARSVSGEVPSAGFGLTVHTVQTRTGQLDDYGLLIYPTEEPEYKIIMHKAGAESILVDRTKSNAIRPGSAENKLEIRIKGAELSFYVNGRFLTQLKDSANFRRGRAGFYTSDVHEVAFDDLVITR